MKISTLRLRRWLMVLLTFVVFVVFAFRLMNIQIVRAEEYRSMRNRGYTSIQAVKATRGELVDRNGQPLAVNRMGYDVILDKAYLPTARQNEIILELTLLLEQLGERWNDVLPITLQEPFVYLERNENEIARLQKLLAVSGYTSAEDAFYWLVDRYKLQDYPPETQRRIAGIRYGMEQQGFTWNVNYTFASDIDISSVIQIKERSYQLEGVEVVESAVRTYPNGHLAPHIIGSVGPIYAEEYQDLKQQGYAMDDRVGKSGAEKAFEDLLRGENGRRLIYVGSGTTPSEAVEDQAPTPGRTVVLTLDNNLQKVAQDSLEKQIKKLQATAPAGQGKEADAGAVAVIKVKTGEVLALVTYPSYDLNTYSENYAELVADEELTPLLNRAVLGGYAPGSTFKPVVGLTGLTHGEIVEGSTVNCTRVYTFYTGYQPTCLSYHGHINVVTALTKSCNIFFYDTGRRTGIDNIVSMATDLGLGQPTGIEISEKVGQVSSPAAKEADPWNADEWSGGDVLQSSIGQLYNEYTPLQLANYAATIANRGTRMKVTLVHEVRDYTMNTVVEPFTPQVAATVNATPEAFDVVIKGMVGASSYGGTAANDFGSYPVPVASKTGTPETNDLPNSTFICFAPVEDPEIAIAVVIEKGWHGYTGALVAREIFDAYFGFGNPAPQAAELSSQPDEEDFLEELEEFAAGIQDVRQVQ